MSAGVVSGSSSAVLPKGTGNQRVLRTSRSNSHVIASWFLLRMYGGTSTFSTLRSPLTLFQWPSNTINVDLNTGTRRSSCDECSTTDVETTARNSGRNAGKWFSHCSTRKSTSKLERLGRMSLYTSSLGMPQHGTTRSKSMSTTVFNLLSSSSSSSELDALLSLARASCRTLAAIVLGPRT